MGIGRYIQRRRRGRLFLGQAIDAVVEYQQRDVHVVTQRVYPVAAANREAVTITGCDPDIQIGATRLDTAGNR
jgi:hypothetical protein